MTEQAQRRFKRWGELNSWRRAAVIAIAAATIFLLIAGAVWPLTVTFWNRYGYPIGVITGLMWGNIIWAKK